MFTVSPALSAALTNRSAQDARDAIVNYINADPGNRTGDVAAALRLAIERGVDIWEAHDASMPLDMDREHWDPDYAASVTTDLSFNFSKERFAHWEEVATAAGKKRQAEKAAFSDMPKAPQAPAAPRVTYTTPRPSTRDSDDELVKKVIAGVAVAAAVVVAGAVVVAVLS